MHSVTASGRVPKESAWRASNSFVSTHLQAAWHIKEEGPLILDVINPFNFWFSRVFI